VENMLLTILYLPAKVAIILTLADIPPSWESMNKTYSKVIGILLGYRLLLKDLCYEII